MGTSAISLFELNMDNVRELSEENVSTLLNKLISDFPRSERPKYAKIISSAFDFRAIWSTSLALKSNLVMSGYKFFPIPYNNKHIMGVKRKNR